MFHPPKFLSCHETNAVINMWQNYFHDYFSEIKFSCRIVDDIQQNFNLKFLQCCSVFLIPFDLTFTKVKSYLNPVMTRHIRNYSKKPTTPFVLDGSWTLVLVPFMLKHKAEACIPLTYQCSIIISSEGSVGKNDITQEPDYQIFCK